nr:immunoglobulin light chain junction region [Macaca mulatta]MOW17106.1 immunoglobulin light chain junction region [Macaca mulatta]
DYYCAVGQSSGDYIF